MASRGTPAAAADCHGVCRPARSASERHQQASHAARHRDDRPGCTRRRGRRMGADRRAWATRGNLLPPIPRTGKRNPRPRPRLPRLRSARPRRVRPAVRHVDGGGWRTDRADSDRHRREGRTPGRAGPRHRVPSGGQRVGGDRPPDSRASGRAGRDQRDWRDPGSVADAGRGRGGCDHRRGGVWAENARLVREGKGHDWPAAKGHQPTLHGAVRAVFERADAAGHHGVRCDHHTTVGTGHGRQEGRSVAVIYEPTGFPSDWPDVAAVASVVRERVVNGTAATTVHHYRTSHAGTAEEIAGVIRGHWGTENGLHWILDVAFREDESRTRGVNLAPLRRVAVSLLKRVRAKGSIETRRRIAAWDDEFLLPVLRGMPDAPSA